MLSVKIENTPEARGRRPGIEAADIVWDEVVEGEITRLPRDVPVAGRPTSSGPIRSVRLTDPLIVWPVGGIFAYSGGAPGTRSTPSTQAPVKLVDESKAGDAMFRDRAARAPHNLFAKPALLWAFGGTPVPPPPLFQYLAAGAKPTGTPASVGAHRVHAASTRSSYTWDAASGTWLRSTGRAVRS